MARLRQRLRAGLDVYFAPQFARMSAEITAYLRTELAEMHRMLRQQSDAADQVAETLGRTLTRLSAEVADLSEALAQFEEHSGQIETSA
jgi:hypothetical protein